MSLSIRVILFSVLGLLGALLLGTGGLGWWALSSQSAKTQSVFTHEIAAIRDLKSMSDNYAVFIVDAAHKARDGQMSMDEAAQAIRQAGEEIRTVWTTVVTSELGAEDQALVNRINNELRLADGAVSELMGLLSAGDKTALARFTAQDLYPSIDPVTGSLAALSDSKFTQAGEHFVAAEAQGQAAILVAQVLAGLGLVALVGAGFVVHRRVLRPLAALTSTLGRLAEEDYGVTVPGTAQRDEVGAMARSVDVLKTRAAEAQALRAEQERERAQAEAAKREALLRMAETMETASRRAVEQVSARAAEMTQHVNDMAVSADMVTGNSQTVAAAAHQALANTETVAAAAEELSASIREIANQVNHASVVSQRAVGTSQEAQASITALAETVTQIGAVATFIAEIAAQTNLLALNATIEAARAGEAGRGFAVVASEVKNLASQTARATEEIGRKIADIQSGTQAAVDAVQQIGATIQEMDHVSNAIAAAIEEQGAATEEITRNVNQAADATRDVASSVGYVANEAAATGVRASTVRDTVVQVSTGMQDLRETLVRTVRTVTADVDRRRSPRLPVHLPARADVGEGSAPVTVLDLSEGGALVDHSLHATVGGRGRITLDGSGLAMAFQVVGESLRGLHLRFDLAGGEAGRLRAYLGDLQRQAA